MPTRPGCRFPPAATTIPAATYVFDKAATHLDEIALVRPQLEHVARADHGAHRLESGEIRADMPRRAGAFLKASMGIAG